MLGIARIRSEYFDKQLIAAYQRSHWQSVLSLFDKAYSPFYTLDETSTPLHWYRGVALYSIGDFQAARNALEKALGEHPYHPYLLNSLGSTYEKLGDHQQAIEYYREALRVNPRQDDTRLNLASVYFNARDYKAAAAELTEVRDSVSQRYATIRDRVYEKLRAAANEK